MGMSRKGTMFVTAAAVSTLASAALGATAGTASAAPAPVVQNFDYSFTGSTFSGDPWPLSIESLQATTGVKPGVTNLKAGNLCNAFVTTTCAGYSLPINVSWINFATGKSGSTKVTDAGVDIVTGAGPVGLAGRIGSAPLFPNLGLVNA